MMMRNAARLLAAVTGAGLVAVGFAFGTSPEIGVQTLVAGSSDADEYSSPDKAREAERERRERERAQQVPPAEKRPQERITSCSAADATPVVEAATDAVPGLRITVLTQTRVVYGESVYLVWSGEDTSDSAGRGEGTIAVVEQPRDSCANAGAPATRTVRNLPGSSGGLTITRIMGTTVEFQTEDGRPGRFNLDRKQYQ